MSEFKRGDWVRNKYTMYVGNNNFKVKTKLLQISIAEHDVIRCTNGSEFIIARDSIELWTPQPGEWCWFWKGYPSSEVPQLQQFKELEELGRYTTMQKGCFNHCEPFIGELPTFLQH